MSNSEARSVSDSTQVKAKMDVHLGALFGKFNYYSSFPSCNERSRRSFLPFVNYNMYFSKRFSARFEFYTAAPSLSLGYKVIQFREESTALYIDADVFSVSLFFKDFFQRPLGKGGGLRLKSKNWAFKFEYMFVRKKEHICIPEFINNTPAANWFGLEISRRLFSINKN